MSRTIEVKILGDASQLERSFKKASSTTKAFDHDLSRTARGAVAASVSFRGLGRSIAFASGYFLGGAGLVYGLKASIGAGESLEKSQRSLAVTIKKNGGNVAKVLPGIERWAKAQVAVGVTAVQAEQGLARASAITGSATKGQRAYTEALLISKATGKSFGAVLIAAAKANNGSTTALARYIGKIKAGTSAQKLYNDVLARYKGQAAANTTASEKLHAALSNVEATIGTALLPTINHYVDALTKWLGKSKNQERLQHDINRAIGAAKSIIGGLTTAVRGVDRVTGGFKNTLELLLGLKVASVLARWSIGIFGVGSASTAATAEVGGLRGALLGLNAIKFGPLTAALGGILYLFEKIREDSNITKKIGNVKGSTSKQVVERNGQFFEITRNAGRGPSNKIKRISAADAAKATGKKVVPDPLPKGGSPVPHYPSAPAAASGAAPTTKKISLQGQLNLADLAIAQASATAGNADDIAALKRKAAVLRVLIAKGGTLAQQTQRNSDLGSTLDQLASLAKRDAPAAKKKARAKAKKVAAQQFAEPFALQLAEAKAGATKTTADDLAIDKRLKAWTMKMIKANKFRGQALIDAWNEIARLNDALASNTSASANQIAQTSSRLITAGLHLTRAQRLALESRISQAEAHKNHVPRGQVGALGQQVNIGTVHVHGVQNGKDLIDTLQKHAKRGAASTRGTHAGSYLGLH